jgi:hypothetical protein
MALYLTIMEGPSPEEATTILASSDPALIERVAGEISTRLGQSKKVSSLAARQTPRLDSPSDR